MKEYEKEYDRPMKFTRAVIYNFMPIKLPVPFYDSTGGPFDKIDMECWLVLYDQDGVYGQCPCTTQMKNVILPLIMTGEQKTYREWYDKVYWTIRNRGFSGESAVELGRLDIALHDLMAKRLEKPLYKFLGAKRNWVNVYASGCGTNLSREEMIAEVKNFIDQGYTTFKMKIATNFGLDLENDIERVRVVREMIGPDARLALDANQLWNAEQALNFAKKVEQYNIAWFEEPVHSHDIEELEKLTEKCPIPISMGESMRNHYPYYSYVKAGVKHLQPIPTNLSGVRDWIMVRDLAKRNNLELTSGGYSHLTASFIATADEEDMVEYLYPVLKTVYDIMELKPKEKDGKFILPDEPGISIVPDFRLLDKLGYIASKEYLYL